MTKPFSCLTKTNGKVLKKIKEASSGERLFYYTTQPNLYFVEDKGGVYGRPPLLHHLT